MFIDFQLVRIVTSEGRADGGRKTVEKKDKETKDRSVG